PPQNARRRAGGARRRPQSPSRPRPVRARRRNASGSGAAACHRPAQAVCYTGAMPSFDFSLWSFFSRHPWLGAALAAAIVVLVATVVHRIGSAVLLRITRPMPVLHHVALAIRRPARLVLPLFGLQLLWQA